MGFSKKLQRVAEKYSINIEYLQETTSTNDIAAEERFGHRDIAIAEYQTKGRGQRGHSWHSATGENLLFTIALKPHELPAEKQFYISKVIPLALVKTFAGFGIKAEIKWTNDIYAGDKKLVGILIENDVMGPYIAKSIAGIGINVNQTEFDPSLPNPVSMAVICGKTFERAEILDRFISEVTGLLERLDKKDYCGIDKEYAANMYRREGVYTFAYPDKTRFKASIEGVMETGELLLRHGDGKVKGYLFTEVEFVI